MSLSVVVAANKDPRGLYLTVFSIWQQLCASHIGPFEIIIVADGGTDYKWEKLSNVRCLRVNTGSPQGTRDFGIRAARYKTILCIESHVIVSDVPKWLVTHAWLDCTLSFSRRIGETAEMFDSFGYVMDLDRSFWYQRTLYTPPKHDTPYPIQGFGHAAFMIDRDFYIKNGGYCLEMRGWGGEEPDVNLLVWHMGGTVRMIPSVWHAHHLLPGAHAEQTDDYRRNFCIAAYEHGGLEYLRKVEGYYNYKLQIIPAIEARRQHICTGIFRGDLNRLRDYMLLKTARVES